MSVKKIKLNGLETDWQINNTVGVDAAQFHFSPPIVFLVILVDILVLRHTWSLLIAMSSPNNLIDIESGPQNGLVSGICSHPNDCYCNLYVYLKTDLGPLQRLDRRSSLMRRLKSYRPRSTMSLPSWLRTLTRSWIGVRDWNSWRTDPVCFSLSWPW